MMKIVNLTMTIVVLSHILFSCTKKDMSIDCDNPSCDTTSINSFLLWQQPLCSVDTSDYVSMIPLLTDYGVIFSNDFCPISKKLRNDNIFCLNKDDGDVVWSINANKYSIGDTERRGIYKNYFWVYSHADILIIDAESGHIVKSQSFSNGNPEVSQIGNHLYFSINDDHQDKMWILRTGIDNSAIDTLLAVTPEDSIGGKKSFTAAPSLYIDSDTNDSLIIFQNRPRESFHVFALNLRTRGIEWLQTGIAADGTPKAPLVHEDRIYINGAFSVHCLDAKTGEEIWSRPDVKYTSLCNTVIHNGVLFLNSTQDDVYALSIDDGRKMWHTQAGNAGAYGVLQMHDGYLWGNIRDQYRTKITKIDPYNGDVLWKYGSHNQDFRYKASFQDGFVIDPEDNSVYTNDLFFAMKLRLPK